MDAIGHLFSWIAEHESVLSGVAAVIAIAAVVLALSSRTLGLFRSRRRANDSGTGRPARKIPQEIRYCRTADGHRVAWSSAGSGYPLVRSLGWFTNLEMEWDSPVASAFWQKLASRFRLLRYDGRGMGLSDRDVETFSPDTRLADLEAVVDASGLERFALMGMSEGGSTALRYAHRHPERVSHLVIWGSFLKTPSSRDVPGFSDIAKRTAEYWGTTSTVFHQMITAMFLPDGNAAENKLFNDLQRTSATPAVAASFLKSLGQIDVRDIAPAVATPTLVLHRKGDLAIPVAYGREFASSLPNARIELLEGNNHWFVTEDDSVDHVIDLIDAFVRK